MRKMGEDLFRGEALDYFTRSDGPGELVHLSVGGGWMNAAYLVFLALVAAGVLASLLVQVDGEPLLLVLLPALRNLGGMAHG
jgi:hypothetical protein